VTNPAREAWGPFIAPLRESSHWVLETRTCLGQGPDMSGLGLWNLDKELDKVERPDMSKLGAGHIQLEPL
jgi:hypothetical protein